ncbi:MAG: hypothetical protein KKI02_09600, partial [Planctomycetes bacterium]|nr:hypothetical protein [Planctomycetota bacterium]
MAAWHVRAALILTLLFAVAPGAGAGGQRAGGAASDQDASSPGDSEVPSWQWLVIEPVGRGKRAPIHTDAIEAEIVAGRWSPPKAGDTVRVSEEVERTWQEATADDKGWVEHDALRGGYACLTVESYDERVMLLDAAGHSMVYANGEPRVGDHYSTGWVLLPVRLKPGSNTFLFRVGRGRVRARLVAPTADAQFNTRDPTLPDLFGGRGAMPTPHWAALPVVNVTDRMLTNLVIDTACEGGETLRTAVPAIPPMSTRKVGFRISGPWPRAGSSPKADLDLLRVEDDREVLLDAATVELQREVGELAKMV